MNNKLITGTLILTISSLLCRFIGFFYRIFLSHTIGAEGMGIFQLIIPLYNLALALSATGIQTALSRLIAAALAKKQNGKASLIFLTGTCLAFGVSLILSVLIRANVHFIGETYLNEPQCISLLRIISLALPFSALHACINGWFFGVKEIKIPAFIQTFEELIRLGTTYFIYLIYLKREIEITPMIAVFGLLTSECISVILSFFFLWKKNTFTLLSGYYQNCISSAKEIIKTGFPLTMNRLLLNVLHSVEAVLIPYSLRKGALDTSNALASFGTVTGMSLPLVLFPTAIINSMSSILLPTISEKQACQNKASILNLVKKTSFYSFFIGIAFTIFFFISGNTLGKLFYQNPEAGHYIKSLSFICPFLFINITLASVMNGLGKTHLCFSVNLVDMLIRIACIYLLVPSMQIPGYIYGLVGGEFICSLLSLWIILRIL